MDFQHRPGGKTGSGGVASSSESNRDRRERLRQLALETIDINKVRWGQEGFPQPASHPGATFQTCAPVLWSSCLALWALPTLH